MLSTCCIDFSILIVVLLISIEKLAMDEKKLLFVKSYMMIYVANAFWHKPQVGSLAPNEKIQAHVQQFSLLHLLLNCWKPVIK